MRAICPPNTKGESKKLKDVAGILVVLCLVTSFTANSVQQNTASAEPPEPSRSPAKLASARASNVTAEAKPAARVVSGAAFGASVHALSPADQAYRYVQY